MIIGNICEFLHCLVQTFLRSEFVHVRAFILQRVEVPLHGRVVIRISGFAHALRNMSRFAEFDERFGSVLCALVTMQNQFPFTPGLCIQGLPQGADRQVTGNVAVRNAGNHTSVMEVYDAAVVSYLMILQKQVGEIRAPFLIGLIRRKILVQPVFEYLMWFPVFIIQLFRADDGTKVHFHIHIFMYGCGAVIITLTGQIDRHTPVTVNTIVLMVYLVNLCHDFFFMGIIIRLPVFPVVIVGVWVDVQPVQQPTDAEFFPMLVDKSISL